MDLIQYVGCKPMKRDNVAGTGLEWTPGQVHEVKDLKAVEKLLAHPDVWARVDTTALAARAEQMRQDEEAMRQRREQAERELADAEARLAAAEAEAQATAASAAAAEAGGASETGLTDGKKAPEAMDVEDLRGYCAAKGWVGHPQTGKPKLLAWLKEKAK